MKHVFLSYRDRARGFTLYEMLVVIAIISILATITYAMLAPSRVKARDVARVADISQLAVTLRLYIEQYGSFPAYAEGVRIGEGAGIDDDLDEYMNISHDPLGSGDETYGYVYDSSFSCPLKGGTRVVVYATMEDSNNGNWQTVCDADGPAERYGFVF